MDTEVPDSDEGTDDDDSEREVDGQTESGDSLAMEMEAVFQSVTAQSKALLQSHSSGTSVEGVAAAGGSGTVQRGSCADLGK